MKINGINGANTQVGGMNMMQSNDSVSKNLQSQIANAQKQLQELSANKEMSLEKKMKKRQEIQQKITDLNNQLRQHQIEQRKEQQAKKLSMNDMLGGSRQAAPKAGSQSTGLSQQCMNASTMRAMISADSAMAQAKIQGNVATRMEGRAGVLESEIKLDAARGDDVEAKKEELAEVEQKAVRAESAQMNTLAIANTELEEVAKAERRTEETEDKDKKTDKKEDVSNKKEDIIVADTEGTKDTDVDVTTETVNVDVVGNVEVSVPELVAYTHVDVCL